MSDEPGQWRPESYVAPGFESTADDPLALEPFEPPTAPPVPMASAPDALVVPDRWASASIVTPAAAPPSAPASPSAPAAARPAARRPATSPRRTAPAAGDRPTQVPRHPIHERTLQPGPAREPQRASARSGFVATAVCIVIAVAVVVVANHLLSSGAKHEVARPVPVAHHVIAVTDDTVLDTGVPCFDNDPQSTVNAVVAMLQVTESATAAATDPYTQRVLKACVPSSVRSELDPFYGHDFQQLYDTLSYEKPAFKILIAPDPLGRGLSFQLQPARDSGWYVAQVAQVR